MWRVGAFAHWWVGLWEPSSKTFHGSDTGRLYMQTWALQCSQQLRWGKWPWGNVTQNVWEDSQAHGGTRAPGALPAIVQAMGNGKWISQQPELQRWDQEPLIPAWPSVQPSAIHMLVEKLWRGLFIRPRKFMLGLRTWFHPGPAPWVTSQPWGCKQELGQTTTLHLFVSHSAWGLDTGRENTLWKEEE